MVTLLGLALLALTLCMSTLAYALRDYARSRLSERLREGELHHWMDWLDEHESELQLLTEFTRTVAIIGVWVCVCTWYAGGGATPWSASSLAVSSIISLVLLSIFAVAIPHALAVYVGESVLSRSLRVLLALRTVLWPIARCLDAVEFLIRRLVGKPEPDEDDESELVEQEILAAVSEGEAQGAVAEEQKDFIESVFRLADTAVSTIMTPRTDIDGIRAEATYEEARDLILRTGHSRVPVYEQSVDHIIGVLYAKDLLQVKAGDPFEARRLMRLAPYVPETKSVNDLLDDFRKNKIQIAIVLDEYGGTAGLVTIEDILEELVGEIDDEYDQQPAPTIRQIDADTLEVDARIRVDEINEELGINLPDEEDYDTIGGFVFSTLGKIPVAGEEFRHDNVQFSVLAAEPRKINRLRIHVVREQAPIT